jgi:hypothetical protein
MQYCLEDTRVRRSKVLSKLSVHLSSAKDVRSMRNRFGA